jgi:NTE family protein
VFGAADRDDVPISTAVRASTALPMVYAPVRVRDRELVDGRLISTTNVDIAVEAGAKVWSWSPARALRQRLLPDHARLLRRRRVRRVSDMGFPQIGCQAFKLLAYQRLHEMARHWETQFSTERGRTRAWRKILGRTTGALLRQSGTG